MSDKHKGFFIIPHMSLSQIEKEYKIKLNEEDIKKLADLTADENLRELIAYLCEIGQKNCLNGKKLGYFIYDTMRTTYFYYQALKTVAEALKE